MVLQSAKSFEKSNGSNLRIIENLSFYLRFQAEANLEIFLCFLGSVLILSLLILWLSNKNFFLNEQFDGFISSNFF